MRSSSIISAFHSLKRAKDFFEDFQREHPGSKGADLFKVYIGRIEWIFRDVLTNRHLPPEVTEGVRREINSDVLAIDNIASLAALLNPQQREMFEMAMEKVLDGEPMTIEISN